MNPAPQKSRTGLHPDFQRLLEVFEKRLQLMRTVAEELRQGPETIVNLDLLRLERLTQRQEMLCQELRALNDELRSIECEWSGPGSSAAEVPPEVDAQYQELGRELTGLQAEITHLSRVHQALLRRARRSVHVMMNVLAFSCPLYAAGEGSAREEAAGE